MYWAQKIYLRNTQQCVKIQAETTQLKIASGSVFKEESILSYCLWQYRKVTGNKLKSGENNEASLRNGNILVYIGVSMRRWEQRRMTDNVGNIKHGFIVWSDLDTG